MSIHVAITHATTYRYDRPVTLSPHVVRLRPAPHSRTPILAYSLQVTPEQHFVNWQQDPFGNFQARLVFPEKATELSFTVDLVADLTVINPFDFFVDDSARTFPFVYEPALAADLTPYLRAEPPGPLVRAWLAALPKLPDDGLAIVDFLVDVNRRLNADIAYTIRLEEGVQTPEQTLAKRLGSCRDSGWLLVQVLRNLGLAARFVSGYLVQLVADLEALDGPSGPTADFTDLHAWAEVYVPGAGWIGLDPTSGLFAGEGHIPLACTPEPSTAAPVTGLVDPAEVTFGYRNEVRRIHEDPRVTKPYSDEQWRRVMALGHHVDAALAAGDVRLTMGGEPTFVSIDDMESAQWNTAADGAEKRALATALTARLAAQFAPGGLLHHGQGKWYPGEPLPRWQQAILWRADGEPLWGDPSLLAEATSPAGATPADAEHLMAQIAGRLGMPAAAPLPAYEDTVHRLWSEARLPAGGPPALRIDPEDPDLAAPDTRAALIGELDASAGEPSGWVLPIHWSDRDGGRWATVRWRLRRSQLFLLPGDSPIGFRLPLDALTWAAPPVVPERSSFEELAPLPKGVAAPKPALVVDVADAPPTALCIEARDGHLAVFLPPLTHLEHALELLGVIEAAAAATGVPVLIEGYPLPSDPRLRSVVVAPDPGVIEVNVQPASSWDELVHITTTLYDEARQTRLGTEKFALDGIHTGTGGGNHLTIGGRTPADSPLLRRPDLLRSLLTFWQHHPSLSYLFSGRFIGATSQAPRVDEGRAENLYELEIAFAELDRLTGGAGGFGDPPPSWLVDRLFRHLLVDVTGNTHRAEFCIDKLFSPDGERGRLGLVELRGFEMPPHARMGLVQALLVRALVARCWEAPIRSPLVRWGTELHDRFLLPHWVEADVAEVTEDLRRHGFAFEQAWLAPFLEFRFPRLGAAVVSGVTIELRGAIEPWYVLGEEQAGAATARYVDSSVERMQVRVEGLTESRHVLTCNRVPVPLQPTATPGTYVAGVRYRAWQPPSCLHPTIGVHSPLTFDLVDRWSGRSVGGCTYHVVHPGGRNYDRFPVNAYEAEARRVSRFVAAGHSPGPIDIAGLDHLAAVVARGEFPRTLDLRRVPGI